MWVVVVHNAAGAIAYVWVFSTQGNGQAGLTQATANLPPGWTVNLVQSPATDTTLPVETY